MSENMPPGLQPITPGTNDFDRPKVYLEIGPWSDPAVAASSRSYTGNDIYVGLEQNQGDYHDSNMFDDQRRTVSGRPDKDNMMFTQGDGRSMPYPDNSIHEIFMGNVLPAVPYEDIAPMLHETRRVMDGSGPLNNGYW